MAFGKDELKDIAKLLKEQGKLQDGLNKSMGNYVDHLKQISELQKNINHVADQVETIKENEKELTKDLNDLLKERHKGSKDEIKLRQTEIKLLIDKIKAKRISLGLTEENLKSLEKTNETYVKQAQQVNKVNLALKEGGKMLKEAPMLIKKGFGKLKGTGIFDIEKSARMAALEMGIVSKNTKGFRDNIYEAAYETQNMGIGVKDLAKLQAGYSSELGKSTQLSQEGLQAISEIAAGTMLGVDGAAALAGEMGKFNISAESSRDLIEETMNMSEKMGVNSTKVLKELQNNLKMANKYHFKGGVKGMAKMAAQATKFNITMETTAGLADKLFDIEGAVEMSAKLNTMGGEWAKLGDPMKLMYQARNDMEGLQESIINATAGMADFNSETGEFEFSGLELHRMRELEKITGISAEQMAEMAKQKAKFAKVKADLGGGVTNEMAEFIEANAQFDKNSGKYVIKLEGAKEAIPIDELNATHENMVMATSKSLKERAEATQTFDDTLTNVIEQFKQILLPILEGLNTAIPSIRKAMEAFKDSGWVDKLKGFAQKIGNLAGIVMNTILEFPKIMAGVLVAGGILSAAKWVVNGLALAQGFNMGTGGFGGRGRGGMMDMLSGRGGKGRGGKGRGMGKMGKFGKMGKLGKMGGGLAGGIGVLGGMAMDYGRGELDDPNSEVGQAMGVASGALAGAGTGAMIGSIIPGLGTAVGAIIGGLVGGIWSAVEEYSGPPAGVTRGVGIQDGVLADGKITPIDSKDKVFEISKPGGAYDKASQTVAKTGVAGGKSNIHISFDPIIVKTDGKTSRIDLEKDTTFLRDLSSALKKELSKASNNGMLNPNPS